MAEVLAPRLYFLVKEQVIPGQFYFPLHIFEQPERVNLSIIHMSSSQFVVLQPIACLL